MQGIFRTWFLKIVTVMKSSGQVIIVAENIIECLLQKHRQPEEIICIQSYKQIHE